MDIRHEAAGTFCSVAVCSKHTLRLAAMALALRVALESVLDLDGLVAQKLLIHALNGHVCSFEGIK